MLPASNPVAPNSDNLDIVTAGADAAVTIEGGAAYFQGAVIGLRARLRSNLPGTYVVGMWADAAHNRELLRATFNFAAQAEDWTVMLQGGSFVPFYLQPLVGVVTGVAAGTLRVTPILRDISAHR